MKLRFFYFIITILFTTNALAQTDSIHHRIFLVGDAGELHGTTQPVIDWLAKNVDWNDERNLVVFLGDNIYPLGLHMEGEPGYDVAKKMIDYEISLVKGKKAKAYFVPGNHDWKNGKEGGWQQVLNQVNYINGLGEKNIEAWPHDGCPGPVDIDLSEKVAFAFIDSQWFLYVHDKPGPGSSCPARTVDEFTTLLNEVVASHQNQLLIIAQHHPLYSFGPHGGNYTLKEHLFPFTAVNPSLYIPMPVIGSIYPIARGVFGSLQDVKHPLYQQLSSIIEAAMRKHPNPIHVAGHDHNLQMIMKDSLPFIVSGSGTNLNRVEKEPQARLLFADVNYGFSMLEVRKSGKVEARFYNINSTSLDNPIYTKQLKKIDTLPVIVSKDSIPHLPDSVRIAADPSLNAGEFKELLFGTNYREEWTTPVRVPVLDLGKEQGGLKPQKQGGGKQTLSLRLEDPTGKEWNLRSIIKYPEAAIPPDLRETIVHDVVQDGVSAAYPYAGLSIAPLAKAAGIPYLRRKVVYIPDDPRLGRFRNTFKNTLATLEEREPDHISKTYNTDELVLKLADDNDNHVDQVEVLKSRLLDNFYMDFDRHEDQWRWGTRDTGKGKIYYAIPRDPDQAFFVNEGLIPRLVNKMSIIPELQGFEDKADNIKTFNRPARNFDRFFLNELDYNTWNNQVDSFIMRMSKPVLETAINQQPREVLPAHGDKILNTLENRKRYFKDEMMRYYRFISKAVNVVGTNQRELFSIDKNDDGSVHVLVNKIDKQNQVSSRIYDRVFDPKVTKEVMLYGLEDADSFVVRGGPTPILVRIIGGPGKDHFRNEGNGGTVKIYDVSFEENSFSGNKAGFIDKITANPQANQFVRLFYQYNSFTPGLSVAWNKDDGLFLGVKGELFTHGFRKDPYAMRQYLNVNHALRTKSYQFQYEADFIRAFGIYDFLIRSDVRAPINITNFFGFGNNTVFDKNAPGGDLYYRARYNIANASFLFSRLLQSWMRVGVGPTIQYYHLEKEQNIGKYVSDTLNNGLEGTNVFARKLFLGAGAVMEMNSRNNQVVPTRGFKLNAGLNSLFGLGDQKTHNVTQFKWDMNVIASFVPNARVVYALRFGVGTNFGHFEIPQAQYLSGTDNLRGYRRNRFAGRTVLYQNTEIRIRLLDFNTYLFPGSFGVHVFNDVGRVWMENEDSKRWHDGYGIGLWLSPIKRFVVTGSVVHSAEEKLMPYFTFGFQF